VESAHHHSRTRSQELCDRIAIIDHGKILTVGTLGELTRLAGEAEVLRLAGSFATAEARDRLQAITGVRVLQAGDGSAKLSVAAGGHGLLAVLPAVLASGLALDDVSIQRPNLQSVFISLTARVLRAD
jgi:ABC-2 type transport system ATP-binding protein